MNKVKRMICHILQHVFLVLGIGLLATALLSVYMRYETVYGVQSIYVGSDDRQGDYKDSELLEQLLREQAVTILRYGAIREQLETDGVFDPDKVIDVTAFANRYAGVSQAYVTAEYRLEDLIRWGKKGIEYLTSYEIDENFLNDTTVYTVISDEDFGNFMGNFNSYNEDLINPVTKQDVTGNSLGQSSDEARSLLVNRYHTIEGKNIEDYVSDWEAYGQLTDALTDTIRDLGENYAMYEKFQAYYDRTGNEAESNMIYVIRKTIGERTVVYTNLETMREDTAYLERLFKDTCDKYIYYDAQDMIFQSNISLSESKFRKYINEYSYAYPDDLQVMIGVRKELIAEDCFATTQQAYYDAIPDFAQNMIAAVICLFLFFGLLVYLTAAEGMVVDKETKKKQYVLKVEDKLPTELFVVFGVFVFVLLGVALDNFFLEGSWLSDLYSQYQKNGVILFVAGMVLICSLCGSFFYYSLVRRLKAHMLWRGSFLKRGMSLLKKGWNYIQNNRSLVVRVWIPYLVFVGLNLLVMLMVAAMGGSMVLILGIVFLDALAGLVVYRNAKARENIMQVIYRICNGDLQAKVDEQFLNGDNLVLARAVNRIGDSVRSAVETSMKDERLKADLITNVSHDLKTPLTSIINYVDLIKREQVEEPKIREYIEVLDTKSQRLKQLTEDLLEASKISSGNIVLHMEKINLVELIHQMLGEFSEKFEQKGLIPVTNGPSQAVSVIADGRRIYRVMENLFHNIFKYALEGTRIYIDFGYLENPVLMKDGSQQAGIFLSIKNISAMELNVAPEELTERFIRGDESRTTEGSGLGLSIAKNLTEAMNGTFTLSIDGDLFKVYLVFPKPEESTCLETQSPVG